MIVVLLYCILGYWAAGKVVYRNYIMFGSMTSIICKKLGVGIMLGWILIPIAIIMSLVGK